MNNTHTAPPLKSIKYGDIFLLGNHVLGCGDARDEQFVKRVIGTHKVKIILSDPPYGTKSVEGKSGFSNLSAHKNILNDDITDESQYRKFTREWLKKVTPYLERKNSCYIFNSDLMLFALRDGMKDADVHFAQLLIWIKNHAIVGRKDYLPQYELIAFGWFGTHEFMKSKDKSILFYPKPNKSPLHPTMKPVGLLSRLILNSTNIGDTVYDPFLGSGSTLIACELTRRKCLAIELDPDYCQVTIDRFKKTTGIEAVPLYENQKQ